MTLPGLNLNIKRVVFKTMEKFDGLETRPLSSREIKQIGGRAGRFGTAYADGQVTCWSDVGPDGPDNIANALATTLEPLQETVLPLTYEQVELHAASKRQQRGDRFWDAPSLVETLQDLEEHVVVTPPFKLQSLTDMYQLAGLVDDTGLTLRDKYVVDTGSDSLRLRCLF